jgi:hypothetical protein
MKDFKTYLIIVLITVMIAMYKCNGSGTIVTDIDTFETISYIHDTIKLKGKTKIKPVPEIRWVHDTIIDSTGNQIVINTQKYTTKDTFVYKTDSFSVTFYSNIYSSCPLDSLNHDLIASVRHKIIEREIIKQIVRKQAFFAGPSVGLNKSSSFIMLDGIYEQEGKRLYKLGVGVNTRLEPVIKAGVYWKIGK